MKVIKSFFVLAGFIIVGFVLSAWISSIGIPEGSGLAGPAIVVGYGIFGAFVGLILGIFLLVKTNKRVISIVAILGLTATLAAGFFLGRNIMEASESVPPPSRAPVKPIVNLRVQESMGLGIAYPKIFSQKIIYFYNPNLQKPVDEHVPYDSLVLIDREIAPDISYAPPWFYPEIMKLDYNMLALKVVGMTRDWIELEVNKQTKRTAWLSVFDVDYVSWDRFLLGMYSVEQLNAADNPLRVRPFTHGSLTNITGGLLVPIEIRDEWLKVEVLKDDRESLGFAWIRWRNGTRLLVSYSLFS